MAKQTKRGKRTRRDMLADEHRLATGREQKAAERRHRAKAEGTGAEAAGGEPTVPRQSPAGGRSAPSGR